jgi:DNA-binding transcriptional ArsR family regulator
MPSIEPRFARIAAQIADPTRARMLAVLLAGQYRSAGELAQAVGIAPQSASTQLAQLLEHGLIHCRQQGRHKYFSLADADVAHALEALSMVAERDAVADRWQKPMYKPLKCARRCYGHLAGEMGVAQLKMLLAKGYLVASSAASQRGWQLSDAGVQWAQKLGLSLPLLLPTQSNKFAYPCMDWSERQDHLAGDLARALLAHYLQKKWLHADPDSRALQLTPIGHHHWHALINAAR